MDAKEIISYIGNAVKKTPAEVYIKCNPDTLDFSEFENYFEGKDNVFVVDELNKVMNFIEQHKDEIKSYYVKELTRRNSAIPLLDLSKVNSRIEPGAYIRDLASIGNNCVIMMGAVINIGAEIGDGTMIDMNVVVGGRALVGKHCHIGAGTVLAGVIEPPSATPVIVEDDVVIGANAVVLEGVRVGKGAVVAAGAVVTKDVEPYTVVVGTPAKPIKKVDAKTSSKTEIMEELRKL